MSVMSPNTGRLAAQFEREFRWRIANGEEPDALRQYVHDEVERFYAQVVQGPNDHTFWIGPDLKNGGRFVRNDGASRKCCRWVWERAHGPIRVETDVWTTCGERNCLTLEHLAAGRNENRFRYPQHKIIGALQVMALRIGHTPTLKEWDEAGMRPVGKWVASKFGTWARAVNAAGLRQSGKGRVFSDQEILDGLTRLADRLGRPPLTSDWDGDWASESGLPRDPKTIWRRFGSWRRALERAGLR